MNPSIHMFLMILACVLFFLAGIWSLVFVPPAGTSKINLLAWGLFAWALAITLGGIK